MKNSKNDLSGITLKDLGTHAMFEISKYENKIKVHVKSLVPELVEKGMTKEEILDYFHGNLDVEKFPNISAGRSSKYWKNFDEQLEDLSKTKEHKPEIFIDDNKYNNILKELELLNELPINDTEFDIALTKVYKITDSEVEKYLN